MAAKLRIAMVLAAVLAGAPAIAQVAEPAGGSLPPVSDVDYGMATQCAGSAAALAEITGPQDEMHPTYLSFASAYKTWSHGLAEQSKLTAAKADAAIERHRTTRTAAFAEAKARGRSIDLLESYKSAFKVCIASGRKQQA
jgi:hypothetical protein